ncbi:fluoride efflux transporter CrcB [Mesorhizobium sp. dw_380]|uniref:fluoride efflux transporter CrcB n=1 Tax=Mesorhizobium sp. dw_380 TaxID=2812001 RepID=UPI001BDF608A|nr:fluoride efflux transporter CrcB [Mesorhizobium sp. dw_380]
MKDVLQGLIWVILGSAIGGPTRYFVSGLVGRHIGETFPLGTMVINVSGAFFMGVLAAAAIGGMLPMPVAWQFAATGFLGSYTTVSSFSLQTLALVRDGQFLRAGVNVTLSLLLCLSAVALGYVVGTAMWGANA